ncbi:MAG TPA: hypothetical protein PKG52_01240 [bacterium]|nr:hypothetical protein [bacterium]HPS31153.1 hypothetical protein [bacterium]
MTGFENSWIICFDPDEKGLLPGTKVHFTECLSCPVKDCLAKGLLFHQCFPMWADPDQSPLNGKIMELNKALSRRKKGSSQLYCPKKKQATTSCTARSYFCKYNLICGRYEKRIGSDFIKSIRWRKVMIFVVMYLDGTSEVVNRNDFPNVDIDRVDRVYPGSYEVKVVSELVPLGEEKDKLSETIAAFNEKYNGGVVTSDGLVSFEEWFMKASNGDSAVIPEKVLVPQKTYRIMKIKGETEISEGKGAEKIDEATLVKKQPVKPVQPEPEKVETKETKKVSAAKVVKEKKNQKLEDKQASIFDTAIEDTVPEKKAAKVIKPKKRK